MITKEIFLDFVFLITAVISQLFSAVIVLRLALSKRNDTKILFFIALFILCIVCPLTIYNLLIIKDAIEFSIRFILTLISLFVLVCVIGLNSNTNDAKIKVENIADLKNLTQISVFLGLIALFSSIILGYLGYSASQRTFSENINQINSSTAHTVEAYININGKNKINTGLLKELNFIWLKIKPVNFASNLYLIDKHRKIVFDSSGKNLTGKFFGDIALQHENNQSGTLMELFRTKRSWSGEDIDSYGTKQFVAGTYSGNLNCLIVVQSPAEEINEQINANTIPWLMGFSFITIILLPLSLGLLHWAFSSSQKNIILAQVELKKSLEEKEMLLKEIHHRVKNNLQIIYSLLGLQSNYTRDTNYLAMIRESQQRIKTMAIIHEKLYQSSDLGKIDFSDYVQNLTNYLFESYRLNSQPLRIDLKIENIFLDIDTAIPCGLIINELFSNSLKHAFLNENDNCIQISFFPINENYCLLVSDNGSGLQPGFDIKKTKSLGLKLVSTLAGQIKGKLEINSDNGTQFKITFKQNI